MTDLKKMLEQINAECELDSVMEQADWDMRIDEFMEGKTQREREMCFDFYNMVVARRERQKIMINDKYEPLYRNHPEFFLTENATKQEREEYNRLHNI